MTTILLVFLGAYAVALTVAFFSGRQLFNQVSAAYDTPHEYKEVHRADLPALPQDGYERVRIELGDLGFQYLGAFENLALSRAYPSMRTYLDLYAHESGRVYAASYRTTTAPFNQQVVDCETVFEDDTFLLTTNAAATGFLTPPPIIERRRLDRQSDSRAVLESHQSRLSAIESATARRARLVRSLPEVLQAQRIFSTAECEYRRRIGYVTLEEMRAVAKGLLLLPGSLRLMHWVFTRELRRRGSSST